MGEEPVDETTPRSAASRLTSAGIVCGTIAIVFSLGGVAFALWSRFAATTTSLPTSPANDWVNQWGDLSPRSIATVAMVTSALLLTPLLAAVLRPILTRLARVTAAIILAYLFGTAAYHHLPSYVTEIGGRFTPSQALPTAVFALGLTTAACVAALASSFKRLGTTRWRAWLTGVGAVMAVLVLGAAAAAVPRLSDPDRDWDATFAAPIQTPPLPTQFGQAAFTVHTDYPARYAERGGVIVRAAGPGFVVVSSRGVRAYDSDGKERWHYLNRGSPDWHPNHFAVFDDNHTVLASFSSDYRSSGRLVAFDAETGHQLWDSTAPRLVEKFNRLKFHAPYFILQDPSDPQWTRIDTRTGADMWTVPVPEDEHTVVRLTDAAVGVSYLATHRDGATVTIRAVVLDPLSGAPMRDIAVTQFQRPPEEDDVPHRSAAYYPATAAGSGIAFSDTHEHGWYVDTAAGTSHVLDGEVVDGSDPAGDFLVSHFRGPYTLNGAPDGASRCSMPPQMTAGVAWLAGGHLAGESDRTLTTFRRSDCAPIATAAVPRGLISFTTAPGVVLVLQQAADGIDVTGYRE